jgi:hypothetical protein
VRGGGGWELVFLPRPLRREATRGVVAHVLSTLIRASPADNVNYTSSLADDVNYTSCKNIKKQQMM